jgi:RimJ/RimL family protein N-acetyltransferase
LMIYNHDAALAKWAGDRIGVSDFGPSRAIGIIRNQTLAAAAIFHHYRPPDIEISFVTATKRWATPQAVRAIMRYPFLQLGCKRLTAITKATNQPTRAFLCRLGFHLEGLHPDVFDDDDAVSYGLLRRDAARWLAEDDIGQIGTLDSSGS